MTTDETIDSGFATAALRARAAQIGQTINAALAAAGLMKRIDPDVPVQSPPMLAPTILLKEAGRVEAPARTRILPGTFTSHTFRGERGSLAYKLYVPSTPAQAALPLIVMLHGCKQDPDDFAVGTRMNLLAERRGFLVAYPAQTVRANGSNCWNWFVPAQQERSGREAALIAGMVGQIAGQLEVDGGRVFVAGLSAGAAMAVVLGSRYPEVFSGVAAHSGLPLGAAHDVPSAFAAMRGQRQVHKNISLPVGASVRTLVFHGDADPTVAAVNADEVVAQAAAAFTHRGTPLRTLSPVVTVAKGRRSIRTDHVDLHGNVAIRAWRVAGGGHTWFGGSEEGSYTDPSGPDASAEVVTFFLERR